VRAQRVLNHLQLAVEQHLGQRLGATMAWVDTGISKLSAAACSTDTCAPRLAAWRTRAANSG